jgi:hypothetical protein
MLGRDRRHVGAKTFKFEKCEFISHITVATGAIVNDIMFQTNKNANF